MQRACRPFQSAKPLEVFAPPSWGGLTRAYALPSLLLSSAAARRAFGLRRRTYVPFSASALAAAIKGVFIVIQEVIHSVAMAAPFIALFFSGLAFFVSYRRSETNIVRQLRQAVTEHELDLSECYTRLEQLTSSLKRMNSRLSMRAAREKRDAPPTDPKDFRQRDDESVAEWKARCRAAIASGALKHD